MQKAHFGLINFVNYGGAVAMRAKEIGQYAVADLDWFPGEAGMRTRKRPGSPVRGVGGSQTLGRG